MPRAFMAFALLTALPLLAAPITVTVSPKPVTVNPSGTQSFTATVANTTNTAVTWTCTGGSFSLTSTPANPNATIWTAPATAGTYTVTATSVQNTQKKDTATVTVPIVVTVSPKTFTMWSSGTNVFSASVIGTTNTAVTWTATGGTIDASGLFTAPATAGTYTVTATSVANTQKKDTATVTVITEAYLPFDEGVGIQTGNGMGTLVNNPQWVNGKSGKGINFGITNSQAAVALNPVAPLGNAWTISAWFKYPLPNTGTWHVLTGNSGGSANDFIIDLHPDQVTLGTCVGGTFLSSGFLMNSLSTGWHQMTVVGQNGTTQFYMDGAAVGSLINLQSTSNVYKIGNCANGPSNPWGIVDDVRIYRRALTTTEITGLYTAVNVSIAPNSAALEPGTSQTFTATVTGAANTAVTWTATGGSITPGGVYTAPFTFGAYDIKATSVADPSRSCIVTVAVPNAPAVAYFPFDEGTGIWANDATGTGIVGTLVNDPRWVAGKSGFGTALDFGRAQNAHSSMVTLDPAVSLGSAWTISAWFQSPLPSSGTWHVLTGNKGNDFQIDIPSDLRLGTGVAGTFYPSGFLMSSLSPGWHQVVVVGQNDSTQFYMDGAAVGSLIPVQSKSDVYVIGNCGNGFDNPFGIVDDVRIHQRALAETEIAALFTATATVNVAISPKKVTLPPSGTQPFTATVTGDANTAVTWSAPGGSITSGGVYTAPSTPGTYEVKATSVADPTKSMMATVAVASPVSSLFAYFPFDEGAGNKTLDAMGNGRVGSLYPSGVQSQEPQWVQGKSGMALDFGSPTPSTRGVRLDPVVTLGTAWTISAWFQYPLPNTGTWHALTGNSSLDFQIYVHSDQITLGTMVNGTWASSGFRLNALNAGWHQVTAVGQNDTTQFYMDGAAVGAPVYLQSKSDVYVLGNCANGPSNPFGIVDEVQVFNWALSPTEVPGICSPTSYVTLSPAYVALVTGRTQAFTATVIGETNPNVTWTASGGTISGAGLYTAPATPGTYSVTATSVGNPSKKSRPATIIVTSPPGTINPVTPANPVVNVGTSTLFYSNTSCSADTVITWTATGGSTNASTGVWTAPATPGTFTITATANANALVTASTTVTVVALPVISTFTASPTTLTTLGSSSTLGYAFSNGTGVITNGVGTVTSGGTSSVSPKNTTTYTLTVTNAAGTSVSAYQTVSVVVDGAPDATIATALIVTSGEANRTASVPYSAQWTYGWTITNGTITSGADNYTVYYTPGTIGSCTLDCTVTNPSLGTSANGSQIVSVVAAPSITWSYGFASGGGTNSGFTVNWGGAPNPLGVAGGFFNGVITQGDSITLLGTFTNGTGTIDNGVGAVSSGAGVYATPLQTTIYTLTVTNTAGTKVTATVHVEVNSPCDLVQPSPEVIVTPSSTTLPVGYIQQFVLESLLPNPSFVWNVHEFGGGSVTQAGAYTAPNKAGTYHVEAAYSADPFSRASASVIVPFTVDVSPQSIDLQSGATQAFAASVAGSDDVNVTWNVQEGASGGTVSSSGLYTAPATPGTYHVVATSSADSSHSAIAAVNVSATPHAVVTVSPYGVELNKGGTQTFTATVSGYANQAVTWTASAGSITSGGVYTAPTAFGTYTVTATSVADATAWDTATVVVKAIAGTDRTFTYDLNGNLISDGQRTFEWDGFNRLVAVVKGTHRSEFSYDFLDRRVRVIEKESSVVVSDSRYLWDGLEIMEQRDSAGGTVVQSFFEEGFIDASGGYAYTRDHLGSIREVTDSSQTVRARYDYDPYGRMTKVSGDKDATFLYTGHFWHAQSGLYLAPYRAYDPDLGRWISRDPIGEKGGLNLYAYVGGDPVNSVDPTGKIAFLVKMGIGAAVGGAYGYYATGTFEGFVTGAFLGAFGTGMSTYLGSGYTSAGLAGFMTSLLGNSIQDIRNPPSYCELRNRGNDPFNMGEVAKNTAAGLIGRAASKSLPAPFQNDGIPEEITQKAVAKAVSTSFKSTVANAGNWYGDGPFFHDDRGFWRPFSNPAAAEAQQRIEDGERTGHYKAFD